MDLCKKVGKGRKSTAFKFLFPGIDFPDTIKGCLSTALILFKSFFILSTKFLLLWFFHSFLVQRYVAFLLRLVRFLGTSTYTLTSWSPCVSVYIRNTSP